MNLLTLSAAFGLLVLVFQDGHLEWLLRLRRPGRDRVQPARAAVRGRVRALDRLRRVPARAHQGAARRRAAPTRRRSRSGLQRTGRIVTFAAALMVIAIGCFVDRPDHLHQAARVRRGGGRADRRDDRPRAARAGADAAARRLELVGSAPTRQTSARHEGDRLPRAGLQRRRPADEPAGDGRAAVDARRHRAAVLVGLRDRAGGRGARPARVLQRVPADRDARSSPKRLLDACKAVERAFGREQAGEDGYVKHGPRAIDVDLLLLGDVEFSSERLTLPHREVIVAALRARAAARARPAPGGARARAARPTRSSGSTARTCAAPVRRWRSGP